MPSLTPSKATFVALFVTSCLLHNFLLATPVAPRDGHSASPIDDLYRLELADPNQDTSPRSQIYQTCFRLLVDEAIAHDYDWTKVSSISDMDKSLDSNRMKQALGGPFFDGNSYIGRVNSLQATLNKGDILNFGVKEGRPESRFSSLEREATQAGGELRQYCLDIFMTKILEDISDRSNRIRERDETENADISGDSISSGASSVSKRSYDSLMSRLEKRRHHLSINNALVTLTDMVVREQIERVMRNRENMRRHLLIQG